MNFGRALESLKRGATVAREGWNGKGMWLALSPGAKDLAADKFWAGPNREFAEQNGGSADVLPCVTMKTADGKVLMGWLATQTDMLAEDWVIVSGTAVEDPIDTIRCFNRLAGNTDHAFNVRQAALYMGLQCEELAEKFTSLGMGWHAKELAATGRAFKSGSLDFAFVDVDRHQLLDDDVDLLVVTVGSLLSQGVDVNGALAEVNRANMAKVFPDGTMHRDANGKITKPEGWTAPDLTRFVCHYSVGEGA